MLSGYRQVKGLVFSGSQYIDTGVKLFYKNSYTSRHLIIDFEATQNVANNTLYNTSNNSTYCYGLLNENGRLTINLSSSAGSISRNYSGLGTDRHLLDVYAENTGLWVTIDGVEDEHSAQAWGTLNYNVKLGNRSNYYFTGIMYGVKLIGNGATLRDYVPALREADGVAGFYDLANDTFTPSATSTPFGYIDYSFNVTASTEPAGVPVEFAGVGEYVRGSYAEVVADARPYGYKINGVYLNGEKVSDASDYRFEVLADTHLIFKYDEVTGYNVTASVFPEKARRFTSVQGVGVYGRGERATISYSDNAHFEGFGIYLNGELATNEHSYSFIVNENIEIEIRGKYRAVPAPYVLAQYVSSSDSTAVNTGILPDSNTEVYYVCNINGFASFAFGSRDANSNTSTGQLNIYCGASAKIGYNNRQIDADGVDLGGYVKFSVNDDMLTMTSSNEKNTTAEKDASEWAGTQPIYLMALNNAGAVLKSANAIVQLHACRIYKNGELVGDYLPIYNPSNKRGYVYDDVTGAIMPIVGASSYFGVSGSVHVTTKAEGNGYGFIETLSAGDVDELQASGSVILKAVPLDGTVFLHWKDANGAILTLGADNRYNLPSGATDIELTAVFAEDTNERVRGAMQAVAFPFFKGSSIKDMQVTPAECVYMKVLSASIKEDLLQRTKSTIEVESVPTSLYLKMPIVLFDEKGAPLFNGVVEEINGSTLTLRELVAVYDFEAVSNPSGSVGTLNPSNYLATFSLQRLLELYVGGLDDRGTIANNHMSSRYAHISRVLSRADNWQYLKEEKQNKFNVYFPLVKEREVINVEDLIIKLFEAYQVLTRPRLGFVKNTQSGALAGDNILISVLIADPTYYDKLTFGDNMQAISNINVTEATQEVNYLLVYNSSGSALRGEYSINANGQIVSGDAVAQPTALDYATTKGKIVFSDDNIVNVTTENLASAMLNHKITLDIDLDASQLKYKDLNLGMPIDFYAGDKLYRSVLTAWEFSLNADDPAIHTIKLTLGKIRTSLTSKLNRK